MSDKKVHLAHLPTLTEEDKDLTIAALRQQLADCKANLAAVADEDEQAQEILALEQEIQGVRQQLAESQAVMVERCAQIVEMDTCEKPSCDIPSHEKARTRAALIRALSPDPDFLAQKLADAHKEAMELACGAICTLCRVGTPYNNSPLLQCHQWFERGKEMRQGCPAQSIRAAFIKRFQFLGEGRKP